MFITGGSCPWQVAVDGEHIYWANSTSGTIGRANLNGSGVNQQFINTGITMEEGPEGLAVTPSFIFWGTAGNLDFNLIGRADIGGTNPIFDLMPNGLRHQLAVHGESLYWSTGSNSIGRAQFDGANPISFINNLPTGVPPAGTYTQAVAVNYSYIYWTDLFTGFIGRDRSTGIQPPSSWISSTADTHPPGSRSASTTSTGPTTAAIRSAAPRSTAIRERRSELHNRWSRPLGVAVNGQ